ncbi:hypothetical protein [Tenacibaculum caenipelagi]|uniref:Uncharacterized protein n=1 Tax=Tenacibaculum caenipelagi TaxID=1325435 RepID=A0A4R6TI69_9FLAO|nr:hypothetical protein [Tenacibaculum caenipelagi]TDQ27531.1 hypothetical protein DFQ07_1382 [Tenacibaculum caenipelagi]
MKNLVLLILLYPILINAQDKKIIELQNKYFDEAGSELTHLKIKSAFTYYRFAYDLLPGTELGKKSLKLSDSLKIILRKNLITDIEGNWEIKIFNKLRTESDKKFYDKLGRFLRITKDSIFYFTKKRKLRRNKPSKRMKITFCELMNYFPSYSDFIHPDNKIWHYRSDSTGNKLIILDYGKIENDRKNRTGNISHPSGYTYNRIK